MEMIVLAAVVLVFFGAKRLPELGRSLGGGIKEFKKGISGEEDPQSLSDDKSKKESSSTSSAE